MLYFPIFFGGCVKFKKISLVSFSQALSATPSASVSMSLSVYGHIAHTLTHTHRLAHATRTQILLWGSLYQSNSRKCLVCLRQSLSFSRLEYPDGGPETTDAECIRNRWRFVCKLRQKVVENQYKMVYYSTYYVSVNRRKHLRHQLDILGTYWC